MIDMSTNKKINLPEGITPEMVAAAVSNPGVVVSKESATSSSPQRSIPIDGYQSQIRPNIPGNNGFVTGPSKSLGSHLAQQAQDFAASEAARLKDEDESKKALSPQSLRRDVEALRREITRLKKQLKEHNHDQAS